MTMSAHVKKGDIIELPIHTVAFGGDGIGRMDNLVVFVPFAVGGDLVEVKVTEIRKRFLKGSIHTILRGAPERAIPQCRYYYRCGGCQYQHITYEHELALKKAQVYDSFERIGKIPEPPVEPVLASPRAYNYRGKAEFHLRYDAAGTPHLGFMDVEGSAVVDVDRCEIVAESMNDEYGRFRAALPRKKGSRAEKRVIFWSEIDEDIRDNEDPTFKFATITRQVADVTLRVPYGGFFQANTGMVETLVDRVIEMAGVTPSDIVLDCYCGSGLFTLFLARTARKVLGIEVDGRAVECARFNLHCYDLSNTDIYKGKAEDVFRKGLLSEREITTIMLDPPRTGCERQFLDGIIAAAPEKVVYISCNPATQARDIRYLVERGFTLFRLQPVDMFPRTKHIEVIALLKKSE
jgi:tRNA/tmRNA/rRNA uracil-C5-methylase (TrmA/RlmC/RlmD family)